MIHPVPLGPVVWRPDPGLAAAAERAGIPAAAEGPDQVLPLDLLGARAGALLRESVLSGEGGLPVTERDLTAMAVARVLGCAWTANVHADRFIAATGARELAGDVLARGSAAALAPRAQAIVSFAERMAATPPQASAADFTALRAAGLTDMEIMDVLNVTALTSASARLALALGNSE